MSLTLTSSKHDDVTGQVTLALSDKSGTYVQILFPTAQNGEVQSLSAQERKARAKELLKAAIGALG